MRRWGEPAALATAILALGAAFAAEPLGWWGGDVHQWLPPLSAHYDPAIGLPLLIVLPVVAALAVAVIARGPAAARSLRWPPLVVATWATGVVWGFGLALLRGVSGLADPLASPDEYLVDVPRVDDVAEVLRVYTSRILLYHPGHWTTHDSGHPPLPLLFYAGLARLGLGSSLASGIVTATAASTGVAAVMVTLKALGAEHAARTAAPFLALTSLVTWTVVSADGMFMAVSAWGLAALALAATAPRAGPRWWVISLLAGLLLGTALFLSYGMVLFGALGLAVLLAARSVRPLAPVLAVIAVITAAFALAGFWWLEGEQTLVVRYYQGKGELRQYSYWVWADLVVAAFAVGPAAVAGLGALTQRGLVGITTLRLAVPPSAWLVLGAVAAILASTLSGLSKSEVERIWLPFMIWLVPAVVWLRADHARRWLSASACWAVAIGVVFRTTW